MKARPLKLFFIYSHDDRRLRDELGDHLAALQGEYISQWWDRQIPPGGEWDRIIRAELETADVFLLLVSSKLIASRYSNDVELARALERARAGSALVVPVLLSPCVWKPRFGHLQAIPARPVTEFRNRDTAFTEVVENILHLASRFDEELARQRLTLTGMPSTLAPQIPAALPFLCDRATHLKSLDAPLAAYANARRRGVFTLVLPGPPLEAHHQFVARLEEVLPSKSKLAGRPVHRFGHVTLPRPRAWAKKTREDVAAVVHTTVGADALLDGGADSPAAN